jgi:AcrR family transcriptional regulator
MRNPRSSVPRAALREVVQQHTRAAYQDAILNAAERVFGKLGYFEAKMADIAQETGVSVGTLYNYFDSKEAVVLALAQRKHEEFFSRLDDCADVSPPLARLEALVGSMLSFFEERGDLFAVYLGMGLSNENECRRIGGLIGVESYLRFIAVLEAALSDAAELGQVRRDLAPRALGTTLGGMLNAAIFSWMHEGRAGPLAERGKAVLDLFMNGARNT